ncbi:MAG TPA: ROK family protein [Bacteroidales bacterium]|nr:ROK family protein [Bacteroidales bacterium]HPS15894.1 ROK family protein [Bacteroidales bacterium]
MKKEIAIGIDIGGTNTEYGFVDNKGKFYFKKNIRTDETDDVESYLDILCAKLKQTIIDINGGYEIKGIGVGAPNGNFFTGKIEFAPNLKWKGVIPLVKLIEERMQIPTVLTNDANAAAYGEMIYGAAKGMKDFIVITLGTGLGSGIVVNGQMVYGHDGFAGELGHTVVYPDGRQCGCGKKGCLETYASATGIVRTMLEMLDNRQEESVLRNIEKTKLTSKDIFLAAKEGDKLALEAFDITGRYLGIKLADAVAFSSPEAIILFGGLARAGEYIFNPAKKYMEEFLLPIFKNKVALLPSGLDKDNAAVLGAAAMVWKHIVK